MLVAPPASSTTLFTRALARLKKKEESKECFSHRTNIVAPIPEVHSKSVFGSFILKQNGKGLGDFIVWVTSAFTSGRRRQERRGESLKVYETHIGSAHPKTKSWSSCNTQATEDLDTRLPSFPGLPHLEFWSLAACKMSGEPYHVILGKADIPDF